MKDLPFLDVISEHGNHKCRRNNVTMELYDLENDVRLSFVGLASGDDETDRARWEKWMRGMRWLCD